MRRWKIALNGGRWLKLFRINWKSQGKENMNVPENGGKDRILFCQVLCSITSLGAYMKRNTIVDIQCWYMFPRYMNGYWHYRGDLHIRSLFICSWHQIGNIFTLRFEVVFYQSCHLMDNFKHLAEEVGRCYTIGCPSVCTMITWSIEKKFIEFLDLYIKGYWYYPSDLHEILSVLS